jgi:hypothetical protein
MGNRTFPALPAFPEHNFHLAPARVAGIKAILAAPIGQHYFPALFAELRSGRTRAAVDHGLRLYDNDLSGGAMDAPNKVFDIEVGRNMNGDVKTGAAARRR